MDPPSLSLALAAGLAVLGAAVAAIAARALYARRREASTGALVAVDAGTGPPLRSLRYRLSGRPDILRRLPDGRLVPIELKSRAAPARGPPPSHRVQVEAYALLVEETTGSPPPFGLLRYGDGREFRVRWDAAAREEVMRLRADLARRYDGRATPSPAKCAACAWRTVCDARAPGV